MKISILRKIDQKKLARIYMDFNISSQNIVKHLNTFLILTIFSLPEIQTLKKKQGNTFFAVTSFSLVRPQSSVSFHPSLIGVSSQPSAPPPPCQLSSSP